jgi:hypothetical protein
LHPHEGARSTRWAPGARRGQSWHRRPFVPPRGPSGATASNLDTHSRPRNRPKCAHAVEFSKTVAPLREVIPPQGARPGRHGRSRGGPTSIAHASDLVA